MNKRPILVVDDNPSNLKLASDLLESDGLTVERADCAEKALQILKTITPSLILMDIAMPGMDGLELTRLLKADPAMRSIPIVALTASAMKGDAARAREAGCDGYITKPIDTRRFLGEIEAHLQPGKKPTKPPANHILIVDDQPANRKQLRVLFESEGWKTLEAEDGIAALEILRRSDRIGLIITDILMPRMDGYQLCMEVRRAHHLSYVPLIIYSSTYTSRADECFALEIGADRFISKPASSEVILAVARELTKENGFGLALPKIQAHDELSMMKEYSELLIAKLEQRNLELEQSEDRFSKIFHANPASLLLTTAAEGRIIDANQAFLDATGYLLDELAGRTTEEIRLWGRAWNGSSGYHDGSHLQPHSTSAHSARHAVFHGKSGQLKYGLVATVPLEIHNDQCLLIMLIDMTSQHRIEEALRRTQRMDLIGRFAGGIAHDFNNMLAVITGHCDLLSGSPKLDRALSASISHIREAANRASALARQLLTVGKGENTIKGEVDLNATISGLTRMINRLVGDQIQLNLLLDESLPTFPGNSGMLDQLVLNLVINACDAMPGGGTITIRTSYRISDVNDHDPIVSLEISDTGNGISPAAREHIFEPFFTTKESDKGTGLGLCVVYSIVNHHSGHISVDSQPGRGTTFRIDFPLHKGVAVVETA